MSQSFTVHPSVSIESAVAAEKPGTLTDAHMFQLLRRGWTVVEGVLSRDECNEAISEMWRHIETVAPLVKRDDPATFKHLPDSYGGLFKGSKWSADKCGHAPHLWLLRQNPKVAQVFADLHKCAPDDLLTSYDGYTLVTEHSQTKNGFDPNLDEKKREAKMRKRWWHFDQAGDIPEVTKMERKCAKEFVVQGIVYLDDYGEGDSRFCAMDYSNLHHKEYFERFRPKGTGRNWFKLRNKEELDFFLERGCKETSVSAPVGSVVLWLSKTLHNSTASTKDPRLPGYKRRHVAYICMTPREWATPAEIRKRIMYFENMRTTSHWPHHPKVNPYPLKPPTFRRDLEKNPLPEVADWTEKPTLTPLGRRLVGYTQ